MPGPRVIDPEVYAVLRAVAARRVRGAGPAIDPTSLVHEAWLRLGEHAERLSGPDHLRAVAAMAVRQILVDRVRRDRTVRHGGGARRVTYTEGLAGDVRDVDADALEDALTALEALDARGAEGVTLRFFGGMTAAEIARVQGTSVSTVEADWRRSRAWLGARLR